MEFRTADCFTESLARLTRDEADLKEVYDTERHLLFVACARARDHLLVTCAEPGSEFLDDLEGGAGRT